MTAWKEKIIPINPHSRCGEKLKDVRKLVIHWTANPGATAENHYNYFKNLKDRYASAHIFVDKTEALNIIPLDEVAYHANDVQEENKDGSPWRGVKELLPNANYLSISVEMCVEKDGTFHPDTISRTVDVFAELCKKYGLDPLKDIVRHYDITHKNCPAPWVKDSSKFEDFKKRVNEKLKGVKVTDSKPKTDDKNDDSKNKKQESKIDTSHLPVIKKGDTGKYVEYAQDLLNKKGYKLAVDGVFGNLTYSAVINFQAKNKLAKDGIIGAQTWKALQGTATTATKTSATKAMPTIKKGDKGDAVKTAQKLLNEKGNYKLAVDGIFGDKTEKAVKDFQKKNKLTVDGIIGKNTWSKLQN